MRPALFITALLLIALPDHLDAQSVEDPARQKSDHYVIDPAHTSIQFRVSHFNFSKVQGRFNRIRGSFVFDPDKAQAGEVRVQVDVGSIDSNHRARDEHLRSADYFDVARFPEATFRSNKVIPTDPRSGVIMGDLSILGTTIPVELDYVFNGLAPHPLGEHIAKYRGIIVAGFSARTSIGRSSFGMTKGRGEKGEMVELLIEVEGWRRL